MSRARGVSRPRAAGGLLLAVVLSSHAAAQDHSHHAIPKSAGHGAPPVHGPREPIPPVTDADRAAAFPDVGGHAVHDDAIRSFVQFDRLEAWDADDGTGLHWAGHGWVGDDLSRLWLRSEGERMGGRTEVADFEMLYGRNIGRWWEMVAGVRQDFRPTPSRTWLSVGVIGVAPYKVGVAATAYVGEAGQTAARLEIEYESLLTKPNRLILQPLVELSFFGQEDQRRGIGAGLSKIEAGIRLRYHLARRFAPYLGFVHERALGETADLRLADGEEIDDSRIVLGLSLWY